jgi:hypothetical protein
LRARLAGWLALRGTLLLLGTVGAAACAAVVLDAALDLPEGARAAAPWVLAGCGVLVVAWAIWHWRRFEEQRVARLFEQTQPALGNRLINAVQLSQQASADAVGEVLRREAVELGRKTAAGVAVWPAVRADVKWAAGLAGLVVAAWLCLLLVGGDILQAVVPRFRDSHGDHPPYSKLRIEVSPTGAQVLYGGQVEVRARASGRPADKLWLVARSGTNGWRAIMFLAPDKTFFQTLANLREPTEYYVTDGRARSYRFPIRIRYTPQITMVEVTTTFPQYTGLATRTAKLGDEPQALPEDTIVGLRVASNRLLKSGQLTLTPVLGGKAAPITLQPEGEKNIVSGSFTLTQAVVFSVSVRDVSDLESLEPRQGRFNLLPDERPQLFVLEPGRDAVATPSIRVPVRVEATDDYGITRVVWLRGLNRSIERPFNMKLTLKSGPRAVEAAGAFDFDQLGVRPGDVIEYYFEAADNYPKGPNVTLSKLYQVEIITKEQYEAILRMAAARKALFEPYFQLANWLRRLAEKSRTVARQAASGSEADQQAAAKDGEALAKDLAKYEGELGKLLQEAVLFDVEQSFRRTLVEQHTAIGELRQKLGKALGGGQLDPKKLGEAASELSQLAQEEEEDVNLPAQQIAAVAHLLARAVTFVKLAQQQATLAQMLRRFADRSGDLTPIEQMEMQELAYQQRRIQEGLRALLNSLPQLLASIPDEPQYAPLRGDVDEFIQAVAEAGIEEDLKDNTRNLSALDGKSGYALALQAAEKMDRLIGKCRGMPGDAKSCLRFKPSVQEALGNTLEQILAAMGVKPGSGQGGQDGYALFNDDVALYGPNVELAGEQGGGPRERGQAGARRAESVPGGARDPALNQPATPGRVRLQPDAKFPLRYRDLVGEYFKVIGESEREKGTGK